MIDALSEAAGLITPATFAYMAVGMLIGLILAMIPGLTATMGVVLLLPVSFHLDPVSAIVMLAGAYKGGFTGSAIAAVLIGVPGTPSAIMTVYDGHALTKQGKAGKGLQVTRYASIIADAFSDLVLLVAIAPIAALATVLGQADFAALILLALILAASIVSLDGGVTKGLISLAFGALIAIVGTDPVQGVTRFTFSRIELLSGFDIRAVLIGLFALSEVFIQLARRRAGERPRPYMKLSPDPQDQRMTWGDFKKGWRGLVHGSIIGTILGALPGLGGGTTPIIAYGTARRFSRKPQEYGKGSIEGLMAAESADSAVSGANLIPLFSFGIPGDIEAAILTTGFIIHGLTPGPGFIDQNRGIVYAIILMLFLGNLLMFVVSMPVFRYMRNLVLIRTSTLMPLILVFSLLSVYADTRSVFSMFAMIVFGIVGFGMRWFAFPIGPFVLGYVLGPPLEIKMRRALLLARGDWVEAFSRPVALSLIVLTVLVLIGSYLVAFKGPRLPAGEDVQ